MRDLFTKDIGWKLFSLALAAGIWFTVSRILHESALPTPETVRMVIYEDQPVTLLSSNADVHAFQTAPAVIKVTVVGPDSIMNTLQGKDIHAYVNFSGKDPAHTSPLPVEVSLPPKVAVASIDPDKVLIVTPSVTDNNP